MLYTYKYARFLYVKQHKFLGKKISTKTNQVPEKKKNLSYKCYKWPNHRLFKDLLNEH